MRGVIRDSILAILDKVINAIESRDTYALSKLSNYTIHNASIFQDEDSLSVAIIIYSLSKILGREREIIPADDKTIIKSFLINLRKMKDDLINKEYQKFRAKLSKVYKSINMLDSKTSDYIEQVILKSKIKKGTAMFQHGISLSKVAEVLDISKWDLMEYTGLTSTFDKEMKPEKKAIRRLKFAKNLFGL
jgi:hypothetical protein